MTRQNDNHGADSPVENSAINEQEKETPPTNHGSKKWLAITYAAMVLLFALGFWLSDAGF